MGGIGILRTRNGLLAGITLVTALGLSACRLTEVALVTVRNDTRAPVAVELRIPGEAVFRDDLMLAPADEGTLLKYEEPRRHARPIF